MSFRLNVVMHCSLFPKERFLETELWVKGCEHFWTLDIYHQIALLKDCISSIHRIEECLFFPRSLPFAHIEYYF